MIDEPKEMKQQVKGDTYMTQLREPDFMRNWIDILRDALDQLGFEDATDAAALPDENVDITYFAAAQRLVPARPRAIHKATDFAVPPELQGGFENVRTKIEQGHELKPHLSRFTRQAIFKDRMLNDWGIHHLHLGTVLEPDGFVQRTGPVLFVRFEEDDAYLITVLGHGAWADVDLLEKVLRDWPELLASHELRGIVGAQKNPTAKEILKLRRAGVQPLVTLSNDKVYAPIGGGLATDGTSVRAVSTADDWRDRVRALEGNCKASFDHLCQRTEKQGVTLPDEVSLRLVVHQDELAVLVEEPRVLWTFA